MLRRQKDIQFEMVLFISQTNTAFTLCDPGVIEIYCCSPVSAQNLCSHNITRMQVDFKQTSVKSS